MTKSLVEQAREFAHHYAPTGIRWFYRGYHTLTFLLVLSTLLTDPEAEMEELGPDLLLHLWDALFPSIGNEFAQFAHTVRAGQAAHGFFSGDTRVPPELCLIDAVGHLASEEVRRNSLM